MTSVQRKQKLKSSEESLLAVMEALLRKYDKECMKMAMLKHEQVFKQQVHELHRLYRIQKLLMGDIKNSERKGHQRLPRCSQAHPFTNYDSSMLSFLTSSSPDGERRCPRRRALDLELPADEYIVRAQQQTMVELEQGIDVELTLTMGNNNWTNSDSSSFSSSSAESGGGLRLSSSHERELRRQVDDVHLGYQNGLKSRFEVEEGTWDEGGMKQSPSWFMECLSLKMA